MSETEFRDLVDRDLRRRSTTKPSELDEEASALLRHPDVAPRWHNVLSRMQKSVEGQLAARDADYEASRSSDRSFIISKERELEKLREHAPSEHPEQLDKIKDEITARRLRMEEKKQRYLVARAKSLRFKSGLEQHMIEARGVLERSNVELYRSVVATERNHLARRVEELEAAIRRHRDGTLKEVEEESSFDEQLWRLVS